MAENGKKQASRVRACTFKHQKFHKKKKKKVILAGLRDSFQLQNKGTSKEVPRSSPCCVSMCQGPREGVGTAHGASPHTFCMDRAVSIPWTSAWTPPGHKVWKQNGNVTLGAHRHGEPNSCVTCTVLVCLGSGSCHIHWVYHHCWLCAAPDVQRLWM